MRIQEGKFVSLKYRLTDGEGNELDLADEKDPFVYEHGAGEIVEGLEAAIDGLSVGDKKKVVVSPEMGYGVIDPKLRFFLKKDVFPETTKLAPGMTFVSQNNDGTEGAPFTVLEVEGDRILVDGNHPLAGKELHFDVVVLAIKDEE